MKKRLILAITTIFLILNCFVVFAEETEDYQYEVQDGKAVLTSYLGTEPILEILLEIEGYTVVGLEETFKENRFVQEITIPDGIEFLGEKTFYRCRNLESVILPDSITEMGSYCFSESAIKEIYIPSGLENLPLSLFYGCQSLESVDFSNSSTKSISQAAFFNCSSLIEINIPNTVTEIGYGAFGLCDKLEIFTIPENIETIVYDIGRLVSGKNLKMIVNLSNKEFDRALFDGKESNYAWFTTENGYELAEYLPASSTIYRREKDSSKKYLDKYLQILSEVNVSMRDINTEEQILEFVISKKPEPDFSSINSEIEIRSFYAAAEGNEYTPQGFEGSALILIKVINSAIENDTAQEYITINIEPIPYKEEEKPSEEESTDNNEEETTDNNEEETTDKNQDETTDSDQEEETSSNDKDNKDTIKKYIEQVLQSMPESVSMEEVNTEEEAITYSKSFLIRI